MTTIRFVEHDGKEHVVAVENGVSLMLAARNNDIHGIVAECGGSLSCGSCHVYVDPEWVDRVPPAREDEETMLECVVDPEPNSRLSCQIVVTEDLDGLVVHIPAAQF